MTSEIVLINDMSVALAADSAGSWPNRGQVFNTADKIYQLAGRQPVGFMNYGNGAYMSMSWDRIFGMYREEVRAKEEPYGASEAREFIKIETNSPNSDNSYWEREENSSFLPARERRKTGSRWIGRKGIKDMTVAEIKAELRKIRDELRKKTPPENGPTLKGNKQELWDRLKKFQREPEHGYVEHFIEWLDSPEQPWNAPLKYERTAHELAELIHREVELFGIYAGIMNKSLEGEQFTQKRTAVEKGLTSYRKGLEKMAMEQLAKKWKENKHGLDLNKHKTLLRTEKKTLDALVEIVAQITEIYLDGRWKSFINDRTKEARDARRNIKNLGCAYLTRDVWPRDYSGIVVAGFGKEDDRPSLVHLQIYSKRGNNLRVRRVNSGDYGNYHPFAMSENIEALFGGIHPRRKDAMKREIKTEWPKFFSFLARQTKGTGPRLAKRLSKEAKRISNEYFNSIDEDSETNFKRSRGSQHSLQSSIRFLDPPDLANLAGKLVEIECAINYVSDASRPVGGPVDVASITKEDGLIWVTRKDTLDRDLNPRIQHNPRLRGRYI